MDTTLIKLKRRRLTFTTLQVQGIGRSDTRGGLVFGGGA